ncbi:MAG: radical SAM protein [Kiritimatiellia bacterium]
MRTQCQKNYRYLYGPVVSRRLGRSLGIDLVPLKTCTSDCIFCQLGRTSRRTVERREYVPVGTVLAEFECWLADGGQADAVALAGSGEPTLHTRFGDVLAGVRKRSQARTVLLSNGTLFFRDEVREGARLADVVKASLSAWDQSSFLRINRPAEGLEFDLVVRGLERFRREFEGEYWIEVFLVAGVNDDETAVERIARIVREIRPDRVHLNTAVRPPAERSVRAITSEALRRLAEIFTPVAEVPKPVTALGPSVSAADESAIEPMVRRHPATAQEIALALGLAPEQVESLLRALCRGGRIRRRRKNGKIFYGAA